MVGGLVTTKMLQKFGDSEALIGLELLNEPLWQTGPGVSTCVVDMRSDLCGDMCLEMCSDMCRDMCLEMCSDMCVDMCADMC